METGGITLVIAIAGAVAGSTGVILGAINTWINVRRDRVRLRVRLSEVITAGPSFNGRRTFAIEALNLSEFSIVVTDIGLNLTKKQRASLLPADGLEPRSLAGKPLAGFRATPSRLITVLYGMTVYVIRINNPLLHRLAMLRNRRLEENRGFRPSF